MIRYWLACWAMSRRERRVERLNAIADRLIVDADRDYARELGILPPLLPQPPIFTQNNYYNALAGDILLLSGSDHQRRKQEAMLAQMILH